MLSMALECYFMNKFHIEIKLQMYSIPTNVDIIVWKSIWKQNTMSLTTISNWRLQCYYYVGIMSISWISTKGGLFIS